MDRIVVVFQCEGMVNVVDTIGLCDSTLKPTEVTSLIKDHIQTNLVHIDSVVIVCV